MTIPQYKFYHVDSQTSAGGVAVYVSDNFTFLIYLFFSSNTATELWALRKQLHSFEINMYIRHNTLHLNCAPINT